MVKDVGVLYKTWSISFDVMPTKVVDGNFNIIRVGHSGVGVATGGSRLPAIYLKNKSTALEVRTEIDGAKYEMKTEEIAINSWTHVEMIQAETTSNVFEFIILINNKEVHRKRNTKPTVSNNIKVYASAGDHSHILAAHARIRNIIHQSPLLGMWLFYLYYEHQSWQYLLSPYFYKKCNVSFVIFHTTVLIFQPYLYKQAEFLQKIGGESVKIQIRLVYSNMYKKGC